MTMRLVWRRARPAAPVGAQARRAPGGNRSLGAALGMALALAGCSGDTVKPYEPITDPTQLYMQLVLNYGAINLSTAAGYNTFQLTSTPLNALGEPLSTLPAPTFRSSDTSRVQVSPTGLLTALKAGTNITVITELTTSDNVRHADTAMVNVVTTDPPPELATLTIAPPDSATLPIVASTKGDAIISTWYSSTFGLVGPQLRTYLKTLTPGGTTIPSFQVEYLSLDAARAKVERRTTGKITTILPGPVALVVRMVAYGVPKADTVVFTVTAPVAQGVKISGDTAGGSIFQPSTLYIRQNGLVYWANYWGPVGVVFDGPAGVSIPSAAICQVPTVTGGLLHVVDPTACDANFSTDSVGSGNLLASPATNRYRVRQFPVPGTYTYRDTLSGSTGQIIVTDSVASAP